MKRTVLVLLNTLGLTAICYTCQAEPMPYGYDYLGVDKFDPQPKKKPNAKVILSRLGRNWFGQNSGITLTNEQQQYTPKNEVSLPNSLGSDLYESSEGLILPNLLSGHNLYVPTKELCISKSTNGTDWYGLNKVVMSKEQPQYANKDLFLPNGLHGFDLYVQDSWYHILNKQKKELSLPSPNGQESYDTDIGLILSDGHQHEPDKKIFLSNSLSGEDWTGLNGGMSGYNEPNEHTRYADKEEVSVPKTVENIWYRPNVDVYLPKRREENKQWDKPTKGIILHILTKKIYYDVYETLNSQNLKKQEEYIVEVVMQYHKSMFRSKLRTNDDSSAYLYNGLTSHTFSNGRDKKKKYDKHQKRFKIKHIRPDSNKHGGQKAKKHGKGNNKIYDKKQKRFEIEHIRYDSHEHGGQKAHKLGKGKNKKYDKNQKRFKIVDARLIEQHQNQQRVYMQYITNFQNDQENFQINRDIFQSNHDNFQNNHNSFENKYYIGRNNNNNFQNKHNSENHRHKHDRHEFVDGQSIRPNLEPPVKKPKVFWEEYGDGPVPEILVSRPDDYWFGNNKRPKHDFK